MKLTNPGLLVLGLVALRPEVLLLKCRPLYSMSLAKKFETSESLAEAASSKSTHQSFGLNTLTFFSSVTSQQPERCCRSRRPSRRFQVGFQACLCEGCMFPQGHIWLIRACPTVCVFLLRNQ